MTTNLEKLEALLAQLEPERKLIREGELAKARIFKAVGDLSVTFDPADADDEDEIREHLSDLAYGLDHSWNGNDEWETWSLGERAEFWVPSTC